MNRLPRGLGFDRFSGFYLWALIIIIFTLWQPQYFPTLSTVHSVTADRSTAALLALAVVIPLTCGAFDLSVGAIANFSTISAVLLIINGWSWPSAAIIAVVIGAGFGVVNGLIVTRLKISSFITTLGTTSIITALQIIITDNGQPLPPQNEGWANVTQFTIFGFQVIFFYMLIIATIIWWVLQHTPAGRYMYAIGSSPEAARLSGTRVDRYTFLSLVASGTVAGVAGALYASLAGPSLTYGSALLLPAFAAVFLGSTQIIPGRFNVWGTVLAIFVLATGVKGLQLATDAQWLDPMFSGLALLAAVGVAVGRQRSGEERTRRRLVRESEATAEPEPAAAPTT